MNASLNPNNIAIPWSTVGYLTYKRTYARTIEEQNRTEEFPETIERVLDACDNQHRANSALILQQN